MNDPVDWAISDEVLKLYIAKDWSVAFRARVEGATGRKKIIEEASRATLEALTRKLRTRKWVRHWSSKNRRDRRMDSRYYLSPRDPSYRIRISNHCHPNSTGFRGAEDYVIDTKIMETYNVLGLIRLIESDERAIRKNK